MGGGPAGSRVYRKLLRRGRRDEEGERERHNLAPGAVESGCNRLTLKAEATLPR